MPTHSHTVLTVVVLFFFGLISPGPNFVVVAQAAASGGRVAGFLTGIGAAVGDAIYATVGLFGVTNAITVNPAMTGIKLLGGFYLAWLGTRMISRYRVNASLPGSLSANNLSGPAHLWRGLTTDLANPKTVVFFASIFATAVTPATTTTARAAMLLGIVLTSIVWRCFVSVVFSTTVIRKIYYETEDIAQRLFGAALCVFGVLLMKAAVFSQ